jgi:hypothetical protein
LVDAVIGKVTSALWAKTSPKESGRWHPLVLHMLDVAASADAVLAREPHSTAAGLRIPRDRGDEPDIASIRLALAGMKSVFLPNFFHNRAPVC